jgi:ribosomal protein L11 methyltransferase
MQFGRRLWVCPAGNRPEAPAAVVVDLEPGLAFGTGTHPTTALCLKWLDGAALEGRQVLDYGCGSGILAVAAARLGAARVLAVDHDPQALQATAANAAKNRVADRVLPVHPTELPDTAFDVVLANILAGTLMQLAPLLGARTVNGGELVLAGILEHQADEVAAAYREMFELGRPHQSQEWVLLHGYRRGR